MNSEKPRLFYKATVTITDIPLTDEGVFKDYGQLRIKVSGKIVNGKLSAVIEIDDNPVVPLKVLNYIKNELQENKI